MPHLASHFILGRLAQELDVIDFAISVEGVHEDAQAPAWRSVFVIQLCEHPVLGLCLHLQSCLLSLLLEKEVNVMQLVNCHGGGAGAACKCTGDVGQEAAYSVCHKAEGDVARSICCDT